MAKPSIDLLETPTSTTLEFDGNTLWTLVHDPAQGKPYIHPLASTAGLVFTDLRPDDHPWHRGVWFSWKYINGINYWEEDRATGKSKGETRLLQTVVYEQDTGVSFDIDLAYTPKPGSDEFVLREQRTLHISHPDDNGVYTILWSSTFTAQDQDVRLDRTPIPGEPNGKKYGGYAGLSVRMNSEVLRGRFTNSEEQVDRDREAARWQIYQTPQGGSLLFMDHPDNLNAPAKWYLAKGMPYFSPAVIHEGPHTLKAHKTLELKYALAVYPGNLSLDAAGEFWGTWVDSSN
ncbi:MAG: PmoA family protein [Planctomycetota bacterium]